VVPMNNRGSACKESATFHSLLGLLQRFGATSLTPVVTLRPSIDDHSSSSPSTMQRMLSSCYDDRSDVLA